MQSNRSQEPEHHCTLMKIVILRDTIVTPEKSRQTLTSVQQQSTRSEIVGINSTVVLKIIFINVDTTHFWKPTCRTDQIKIV